MGVRSIDESHAPYKTKPYISYKAEHKHYLVRKKHESHYRVPRAELSSCQKMSVPFVS